MYAFACRLCAVIYMSSLYAVAVHVYLAKRKEGGIEMEIKIDGKRK